jgi:hypothetical protein
VAALQLRDPATRAWLKERRAHPDAEAFLIDPELLCLARDWVSHLGDKPSSGMVGVLAALTLCRHVDLYGFNSASYFNVTAWSHYYDHERPKPGREKVCPSSWRAPHRIADEIGGRLSFQVFALPGRSGGTLMGGESGLRRRRIRLSVNERCTTFYRKVVCSPCTPS